MTDHWSLGHSRDGYHVTLYRQPRWAIAVAGSWDALCDATRGWLGGHGMPEWAWKIPVGRPRWDRSNPDDPWLQNSLASRLNDTCSWLLLLPYRQGTEFISFPIDRETALAMHPQFVAEMDEIDAMDDDDEPVAES